MTNDERAAVIEECVRLALEKAIKLEYEEIGRAGERGGGVRSNPTAIQWRTIANELRALARTRNEDA